MTGPTNEELFETVRETLIEPISGPFTKQLAIRALDRLAALFIELERERDEAREGAAAWRMAASRG